MSHRYEVIVSNVGRVCETTNRAIACREYGHARASAAIPGGRDGWETVTLYKDGEPLYEFNPGPFWFVELTDTYGVEANYSWVRRVKVQGKSIKHALRRFSDDAGFKGRLIRGYDDGETIRYDIRGAALCFFISAWDEERHADYFHVKEL